MKINALALNCSLKKSSGKPSNTDRLLDKAREEYAALGVGFMSLRIADYNVLPGTKSDMGEGDEWSAVLEQIKACDILLLASPVWVGHHSSLAQRVIERLDALFFEKALQDEATGQYLTYNKVGGAVVTGNEDGAKASAFRFLAVLSNMGFTIPPNAFTYWVGPAGSGPSYIKAGGPQHLFTNRAMKMMVHNTAFMAELLKANPVPTNIKALSASAKEESDSGAQTFLSQ